MKHLRCLRDSLHPKEKRTREVWLSLEMILSINYSEVMISVSVLCVHLLLVSEIRRRFWYFPYIRILKLLSWSWRPHGMFHDIILFACFRLHGYKMTSKA